MKFLSRLLLLCLLGWGTVFAQSNLPACPSSGYFHSCFGTYTVGNGNKYVGEFKYDMLNGKGTYTTASGIKYVGEFKDGKYNGQGTFTFANGTKYVGAWKDDAYNGQGTFTFAHGNKYVGDYKCWRRLNFDHLCRLNLDQGLLLV